MNSATLASKSTQQETLPSIKSFKELGLPDPIMSAIADTGYETPTPIQLAAIPPLLNGQDVVGQAQTGTGKTAAFALPALSRLDLERREPQILVLTPTRELAIQVAEAMQTYSRYLKGFHVLPVYGGQGMDTQLRQLRRGVHAVVGTPGRIQDHIRRGTLKLAGITTVVLDEADEMLRMGFVEEVDEILSHTPQQKQVALFSATMPGAIRKIAQKHLREPVEIKIKSKSATVATVRQRFCQVTARHKLDALTRILEAEEFEAMVIFVRTKTATVELAEKLEARGFSSAPINGDMNQILRERTIGRLKNGALDILVATDVAARGLDVERLSHVVNYDIPHDAEAYIHRIGRTARAGRSGEAIIFVAPRERRMLNTIERATGKSIESMPLPSQEDIADRRIAQFYELINRTIESEDLGSFESIVETYQHNHDVGPAELAAALAFLVQRERPLKPDLPAIPEQKAEQPPKRKAKGGKRKTSTDDDRPAQRGPSEHTPRAERAVEPGMVRYRLAVGREHEVLPKHIVGAIANEAGLSNREIGNITINDRFTLVDLPEGMPKEIYQHLRSVRVKGQKLRLRIDGQYDEGEAGKQTTSRPKKNKKNKESKNFDKKTK